MRTLALAFMLSVAAPAHAAIVGTLDHVGDTILAPIAFDKPAFNSAIDVENGLSFDIAPGLSGPVRLDLLEGTKNIKLAAAAINGAFDVTQDLPLSLLTPLVLGPGNHPFAISAVTPGNSPGAVIFRLTLTPAPATLVLLSTGTALLWALRRRQHG